MNLHQAIFEDNWPAFEQAVSKDDIDALDGHGHSPLHLAVILNRTRMIDELLERKAISCTTSLGGWTPIDDAIALRSQRALQLLIKRRQEEWRDGMKERVQPILEMLGHVRCSLV